MRLALNLMNGVDVAMTLGVLQRTAMNQLHLARMVAGGYDLGFPARAFVVSAMFLRHSFIALSLALPLASQGQAAVPSCQGKVVVDQVLNYLNDFRAQPRACGQRSYEAAAPLRWELRLEQTALGHAAELAQGEELNHLAANGHTLRERLRGNGYLAVRVGENLAAGQESADEALQTWSSSAKHCENIMQAEFRDVALVCASGVGKYGRYWVMNLGRSVRD